MERLARMTGPDERTPPPGYPDLDEIGWLRSEEIQYLGLQIRMTVTPGERVVQLWELEEGHPVSWIGNVFRIDAQPPCLYLNYRYERLFTRTQREPLAQLGARFWKSSPPAPRSAGEHSPNRSGRCFTPTRTRRRIACYVRTPLGVFGPLPSTARADEPWPSNP
ncbi:hypothetical protein GCM10009853_072720 [Glycomyces scopariae]